LKLAANLIQGLGMGMRHLEWLIGEPAPDPEVVVYEVLPYSPVQADRIIQHLCVLAKLEVGQAGDPECEQRVRQAFGHIASTALARGRPCSTCRRSRAGSAGRRGETCSRRCVMTAAGTEWKPSKRAA
jgi:hypothetical protein